MRFKLKLYTVCPKILDTPECKKARPVEEVSKILTVESYFIVKLFSITTIAADPTEKIDSFKNGSLTKLV